MTTELLCFSNSPFFHSLQYIFPHELLNQSSSSAVLKQKKKLAAKKDFPHTRSWVDVGRYMKTQRKRVLYVKGSHELIISMLL